MGGEDVVDDDRFFSHLASSGGAKRPWFKCTVTLLKGEDGIFQGGDYNVPYCLKCKMKKKILFVIYHSRI